MTFVAIGTLRVKSEQYLMDETLLYAAVDIFSIYYCIDHVFVFSSPCC